jgi:choline dehydrogenase-like flavoprotein
MLFDARSVPRDTVLQADVCIIGSGAAGITLARTFLGTSHSVLVLESGAYDPDTATQQLYAGDNVGAPMLSGYQPLELDQLRLRQFGGTTNHWAGWCRPLEPVDFTELPARPGTSWPFGREELDPWYVQAMQVCQAGPFEYDWPYWAAQGLAPPPLETDAVTSRIIQVSFPTPFGEFYRDELVDSENVSVGLWANVTGLRTDGAGGRVVAADVATLDGNSLEVEARVFVVATGGMEVPRLLLASNDVRAAGLGNEHDLVGRYFMEHLEVPGGFLLLWQPPASLGYYDGSSFATPPDRIHHQSVGVKGAHLLSDEVLRTEDLLGVEITLIPLELTNDARPDQVDGVTTLDVAELMARMSQTRPETVAYVRLLAEQAPNPDSRVLLGSERDALGVPQVEVDWRPTADDRQRVRRATEVFADEVSRAGLGRLQVGVGGTIIDWEDAIPGPLGTYQVNPADFASTDYPVGIGFHHMGTARMHTDPTQGVVDAQCRVHSVENLYVAGSAVFPTSGSSTPTLTIVALALRLAAHLRTVALA